jgi:hypothetical protein
MSGFSIGIKTKRLSKKEKIKRLLKKTPYIPTNIPIDLLNKPLPILTKHISTEAWKIPGTMQLSSSVESKFLLLNRIFSHTIVVNYIKESLTRIKFKMPFESKEKFEASKEIRAQINSYYTKQETEWNKVRGIYLRLFRFKQFMTPLIYNWKVKLAKKNIKNVDDPVTLEIPKKPVLVIDINKRISFVYEARSIRKSIEERLLFSDYMFSEPLDPLNILSNKPLTYGQIVSICKQCKDHGEYSWILEEFKIHGTNLKNFITFNRQKLNLEAVNSFFKKNTYTIRETVIDFFVQEADMADLPRNIMNKFIRKYDTQPNNELVQKWVRNTKEYYIAKELNDLTLLNKNQINSENLISAIYQCKN